MLLISESDVKQILSMGDVIKTVEEAYTAYSNHLINVPPRVTMHVRGETDSAIFLTANHLSIPFYGLKQASSFPSNVNKGISIVISDIHLYSADTGEPLAVLSANNLTAMKTGAASAVATKYLAKKDAAVLAIIGPGVQAQSQLAAIQEVRTLKEVRVYGRARQGVERFIKYVETIKNANYTIIASESANDCVYGADIVTTTTTATQPVFNGDYIIKGTHVNAVGSFTPNMQEIDYKTVLKADKVVTDNQQEVWEIAGDLVVPLKEGVITKSRVYGELGDIVAKKIAGREKETEITIYESVGFAALDIALAVGTYTQAVKLGIGTNVDW